MSLNVLFPMAHRVNGSKFFEKIDNLDAFYRDEPVNDLYISIVVHAMEGGYLEDRFHETRF
jgi:hypothetical protein